MNGFYWFQPLDWKEPTLHGIYTTKQRDCDKWWGQGVNWYPFMEGHKKSKSWYDNVGVRGRVRIDHVTIPKMATLLVLLEITKLKILRLTQNQQRICRES